MSTLTIALVIVAALAAALAIALTRLRPRVTHIETRHDNDQTQGDL